MLEKYKIQFFAGLVFFVSVLIRLISPLLDVPSPATYLLWVPTGIGLGLLARKLKLKTDFSFLLAVVALPSLAGAAYIWLSIHYFAIGA